MEAIRVLIVDNYDSFTYNLVQMLGDLGAAVQVFRNDAIDAAGVNRLAPDAVVLSPGPCTPAEAGCSVDVVRSLEPDRPLLGVCLGHQALAAAFGARVIRGPQPVHGKSSLIYHDDTGLLKGLPSPLEGGRYHSLVVERSSLPGELEVCAWTDDGLVMGLRHRHQPIFGLQFHPESVLTPQGEQILRRFLSVAAAYRERRARGDARSASALGAGPAEPGVPRTRGVHP